MGVRDIEIVPARPRHVGTIAKRMRDIDRKECEAFGHSPKMALRMGLWFSQNAWTALVDGRPEAMFGIMVTSALTGDGSPWFLGTDEVYKHGRALLTWGPSFVEIIRDSSPRASNLVSADNFKAIRLLEKWGFEVKPETELRGGIPFRKFELCAIQ